MLPENPTAEIPATAVVGAPRREKRLVPVAPKPRRTPAVLVPVPKQGAAVRPTQGPAIESKVAALKDPEEILNVVRTEAALRRAQRLSGQGDAQRQTIRILSVCMLFALLAAAIGAMWYLQTSLQGSHRARRSPAAANADTPVPAAQHAPAAR